MNVLAFQSIDPAQNRYRAYTITWGADLWGRWLVMHTWGRVGSENPQTLVREFADADAALYYVAQAVERRLRRGYRLVSEV